MSAQHYVMYKTLQKAGYFVVMWTPEEVARVPEQDLEILENLLIEKGNDFLAEHEQEEDDTCPVCQGTGEGMYDGASCSSCRGSGVSKKEVEYDY